MLSPSQLAASVTNDIMVAACRGPHKIPVTLETDIQLLVRRLTRDVLEQCAILAEQYVPSWDTMELLTNLEVGDAIAADIRAIADERRLG